MRPALKMALPVQWLVPLCLRAAELKRETLQELQEGSVLTWARACPRNTPDAGCGWAWPSPHVTVWGPGTASSTTWAFPMFYRPSVLTPASCCISSHTVLSLFPWSEDKPFLLPPLLIVENPQANTVTLMTRWELLSWLNFLTSVSEVFRDSWEESGLFLYLVWWCDNLDCHQRADVFCSSWTKIISTTEVWAILHCMCLSNRGLRLWLPEQEHKKLV